MESEDSICNDMTNNLSFRAHQPSGPVYKTMCKQNALILFANNDDLKGIYHLVESHEPTYRIKTAYRYDKLVSDMFQNEECISSAVPKLTMNKKFVCFNCPNEIDVEIQEMLKRVEELPHEWTVVQITAEFNLNESLQIDFHKRHTDSVYLTVFKCGEKGFKPFYHHLEAPVDSSGNSIELCQEIKDILTENKHILTNSFGTTNPSRENISVKQKLEYNERRESFNKRMKNVLAQIEKNWFREYRCLLSGKMIDLNDSIFSEIDNKILKSSSGSDYTEGKQFLLHRAISSIDRLSTNDLLRCISTILPQDKELRTEVYNDILFLNEKYKFKKIKRHPLLLIVDEKLDLIPWEKLDILQDHPVTRMPSLHFTYALYKEHENSIFNGLKHVQAEKGSYIINPSLDLKKMEKRLCDFFNYWIPSWVGKAGETPSADVFLEYLTDMDIFVYNGHGSGTQFISGRKIQQMRVNSVVFLFGCGSVRKDHMGPLVEMYDVFHNYLIACSPCVVGMLWEVTDFDTDVLSTTILSTCVPSNAELHWRYIDKMSFWEYNKGITKMDVKKSSDPEYEPELLRAINIAMKEPIQFLTKCAIVSRGLPIKIISSKP